MERFVMDNFLQKKGGAICFILCMFVFLFVTNTFNVKGVFIDSPHIVVSFYVLYIILTILSFFVFFLLYNRQTKVDFVAFLLFIRLIVHFLPIYTIGFTPHFMVNFIISVICLIVYLIMYNFSLDKNFFIKMMFVFFLVYAFQIIIEFVLSPVSLFSFNMIFKNEIATPMGSSNALAAKLVPIFAFVFCNSKKKWKLWLTFLTLFAVLVTRSRTGCANFVIIAFVLYIWNGCLSKKMFVNFFRTGFLFFVTMYYFLFYQGLLDKFFYMETSSSDARFIFWDDAIDIFFTHPITGIGFYYDYCAANPHNVILDLLMRSGLIGLFIAMSIIFFILKNIKDKLNDNFIRGCFMGLVAFFIHGLFEIVFFSYIADFMIWTLIGAMMGYVHNNNLKNIYD